MAKDIIAMTQEELKRLHIIRKILDKKLKQVDAADILGLSNRQTIRIVKKVKTEGDKGIIHKSRGRPSNRKLPEEIKDKAIKLYQQKYYDFTPTLASEKLFEINKIKLSDETLRKWLIEKGLWKRTRKHKQHHQWRERKHHFGEMLQMDGSHHDWFEGRGSKCVLMGYIDDATNRVFAQFYEYEGTIPAMDSFKKYISKYGIPQSVYLDKHTTYKSNAKPSIEDELNNRKPLSQFERALKELGIKVIHANSPQAKGRIERLFETLQDRLVREMRLRDIKTIKGGNRFLDDYLPVHNRRFGIKPAKQVNLHRAIPQGLDLDKVLCIKTTRTLRKDWTIGHNKKLYQVIDHINTKKVVVQERTDGSMSISYNSKNLKYKEITQRPVKEKSKILPKKLDAFKIKKKWIPPMDHPWKKPLYERRLSFIEANLSKERTSQDKEELALVKT